jgi:hypothetical protein
MPYIVGNSRRRQMFTSPSDLPTFQNEAHRIALDYIEPELRKARIVGKRAAISVDFGVEMIRENRENIRDFYCNLGWNDVIFEFNYDDDIDVNCVDIIFETR